MVAMGFGAMMTTAVVWACDFEVPKDQENYCDKNATRCAGGVTPTLVNNVWTCGSAKTVNRIKDECKSDEDSASNCQDAVNQVDCARSTTCKPKEVINKDNTITRTCEDDQGSGDWSHATPKEAKGC